MTLEMLSHDDFCTLLGALPPVAYRARCVFDFAQAAYPWSALHAPMTYVVMHPTRDALIAAYRDHALLDALWITQTRSGVLYHDFSDGRFRVWRTADATWELPQALASLRSSVTTMWPEAVVSTSREEYTRCADDTVTEDCTTD